MKVSIDRSFEKDTDRIRDSVLLNKIADCIEEIQSAANTKQIRNLKKLKGGSIYYRIRIGNYRIGLVIEDHVATFVRFLHRKEIYDYFP